MPDDKLLFAKNLRSNQTKEEKILWYHLKKRRLAGVKFRRQHLIGEYIVDFISLQQKLIIELDGASHRSKSESKKIESVQNG